MNSEFKNFRPFRGVEALKRVSSVCIGSGRFLRAVLVPALETLGGVAIAQPRGDSFVKRLIETNGVYEVETVLTDGKVDISRYQVDACGSLSDAEARESFLKLPTLLDSLQVIGVGITEAGFNDQNPTITHLVEFLQAVFQSQSCDASQVSVINTDNVLQNGTKLRALVVGKKIEDVNFLAWLDAHVTFHNTMVDRITSHRENDEIVPRAEPLPSKALVIEDLNDRLPCGFKNLSSFGVQICNDATTLPKYIALKLLIANATHTCVVYSMALSGFAGTSCCIKNCSFLELIDGIFCRDILPTFADEDSSQVRETYQEWRKRLQHPHFEMSTFFVSQNATQKLRIRILPTVAKLIEKNREPSGLLAYSVAVLLRFLTPTTSVQHNGVFRSEIQAANLDETAGNRNYGDNLTYNLATGEYLFRNDADMEIPQKLNRICKEFQFADINAALFECDSLSALLKELFSPAADNGQVDSWLSKVNKWYFIILEDERRGLGHLEILNKVIEQEGFIAIEKIGEIVKGIVNETQVIDLHTHLFPQSHGNLILYGIDEMLTYHYLVAEYFMIAPTEMTPEKFYKLPKREQADIIWSELFLKRTPISEACQGVITTLKEFGLGSLIEARSMDGIRKWSEQFSTEEYIQMVFRIAKVKFVIMTNIPYAQNEKQVWLQEDKSKLRDGFFKSALRIDLFVQDKWSPIAEILSSENYECTKEGVREYLEKWIAIMKPEYFMMSPPTDFEYPGQLNLLDDIILPLAIEHSLPIAMKFGAERGINSDLQAAGDGLKVIDLKPLISLCRNNPKVKFLATILSRINHHELCVVANKFRNLHIYGCWWYCNNPSMIQEITKMRIEMLGSAFTAQHSDARILDQIIYKWKHSRGVISDILVEEYTKLVKSGWNLTSAEVQKDIWRYFGGSYLEFLKK